MRFTNDEITIEYNDRYIKKTFWGESAMYKKFMELIESQYLAGSRVCVAAADEVSIDAVCVAMRRGLGSAVLVGDEKIIRPCAERLAIDGKIEIIHAETPQIAALKAVECARNGRVDALMKGLVNTQDFLRAVLDRTTGLRTGRLLSHLTVMEIPGEERLSFCSDSGFNVLPDLKQKKEILRNAVEAIYGLGYSSVNVACLAANEKIDPKIPATTDAAALAEASRAGEFDDLPCKCTVEGPMAMDVVASKAAAERKGIKSEIAGKVDMALVPSIECGNILCKTLIHYSHAEHTGFVVGASIPIILVSRSDTAENKFLGMALSCIISGNNCKKGRTGCV